MNSNRKAYYFAALAVFFWSTVATAFKIALREYDFIQLIFYASLVTVFILLMQHGFPEEKLLDERLNPNDMVIRFFKNQVLKADSEYDPVFITSLFMGLVLQPIVMHTYGRLQTNPMHYVEEVVKACDRLIEGL